MTSTLQLEINVTPSDPSFDHLKAITIPKEERILPELGVKLIEPVSGLAIPGVYTAQEAAVIVNKTRLSNFRLIPRKGKEPSRTPYCAFEIKRLLQALLPDEDQGASRATGMTAQ